MDITPIMKLVIELVTLICVSIIIPKLVSLLNAEIGNEKTAKLLQWVDVFVTAAEQTITGGTAKKEFVVNALAQMGYTITDEIDSAIEAAVHQLHNAIK